MTGWKPPQNTVNQTALGASSPPLVLPTVVVGAFEEVLVSEVLVSVEFDADVCASPEPVSPELETLPVTEELLLDSLDPDSLADPAAPVDEASADDEVSAADEVSADEVSADEVSAADDKAELDDPELELGAVAVPPVELQPARSSTAPASAAVMVVRFIQFPSQQCRQAPTMVQVPGVAAGHPL